MASGGKGDPFRERLILALIAVAVPGIVAVIVALINRPAASPASTATPTFFQTVARSDTHTPTPITPTETPTLTPTPAPTDTPTITPTDTEMPTLTYTPTATNTVTFTPTMTDVPPQESTTTSIPATDSRSVYTPSLVTDEFTGHLYAVVPAGEFTDARGSANGEFQIGVYEVSNEQFAAFLNSRGSNLSVERQRLFNDSGSGVQINRIDNMWRVEAGYENHPALRVTWYGARDYCNLIGARLPTATEWHKAAAWNPTTGEVTDYPWGNTLPSPELANYGGIQGGTALIDSYTEGRSVVGAYNMGGNVSEWVADTQGRNRIRMGGGWDSDVAQLLSVVAESSTDTFSTASTGFRCSR